MDFPDTTFTTGTTITSNWLNAVNDAIVDGAANINYTPPFTGGVTTTVGNNLAQTVSVTDFGAVGDGVTDDTAAIQAAANYCKTNKACLWIPSNLDCKVTDNLDLRWVYGTNFEGFISGTVGKTLTIGYSSAASNPNSYRIKAVSGMTLKVIGISSANLYIDYADDLLLYADGNDAYGYSMGYNRFYLGTIGKFTIDSVSGAAHSVWMNENKFFGGRFTGDILIDSHSEAVPNNNIFYGAAIEGIHLTINVGYSNYFHDIRMEAMVTTTFGAGTFGNVLYKSWQQYEYRTLMETSTYPADCGGVVDLGKNNSINAAADISMRKEPVYEISSNTAMFPIDVVTKNQYNVTFKKDKTIFETDLIPIEDPVCFYYVSTANIFRSLLYVYDANKNPLTGPDPGVSQIPGGVWNTAGYYVTDTGQGKRDESAGAVPIFSVAGAAYAKLVVKTVYYEPDTWTVNYFKLYKAENIRRNTEVRPLLPYTRLNGTAAPTEGYWRVGEIIYNSSPLPGGYLGWVCTTGGIAGSGAVFKTFGPITA